MVVTQLGLASSFIGDAGISALVRALAAKNKLDIVCDGAA